jgi:hypothetical protein
LNHSNHFWKLTKGGMGCAYYNPAADEDADSRPFDADLDVDKAEAPIVDLAADSGLDDEAFLCRNHSYH